MRCNALILLAVSLALTGATSARAQQEKLKPPDGHVELFRVKAQGVQIYVSQARADDPKKFQWVFKAPLANLFVAGERGKQPGGYHYAGPTWESNGGDTVVGKMPPRVSVPQRGTIPWLLIEVKERHGQAFQKVTYIQRVVTDGGAPPESAPRRAGTQVGVKYTATYVFFGRK